MLEVIDLMACLRSSVGISYLLTIGIIVSLVSRVMHATIDIGAYQFHYNNDMQTHNKFWNYIENKSIESNDCAWPESPTRHSYTFKACELPTLKLKVDGSEANLLCTFIYYRKSNYLNFVCLLQTFIPVHFQSGHMVNIFEIFHRKLPHLVSNRVTDKLRHYLY